MNDTGYLGERELYLLKEFLFDFQKFRFDIVKTSKLTVEQKHAYLRQYDSFYSEQSAAQHWENIQSLSKAFRDHQTVQNTTLCDGQAPFLPNRRL